MSYEYIDKEVEKIYGNTLYPYPLNAAMTATWIASYYKGSDLKILDMKTFSTLADYFVLITATNSTQATTMAETISIHLRKKNLTVKSFEGDKTSDWILIDEGNVIIHIFIAASREIYDLDGLWEMAESVVIPESLYFSSIPSLPENGGPARPASFDEYF